MSEYKRLTKRTVDGKATRIKSSTSDYVGTIYEEEQILNQEIIDRLAELEDKIEEGKLVELPCKIGDTVYIVGQKYRAGKYEEFINTGKFRYSDIEKFGDTVFLTREAAKARLKELEEKGK